VLREVFGAGLDFDPPAPTDGERERLRRAARRAFVLRLKRAERRGLLPPRIYLSGQRYGWWADALEAALARLPTNYAVATGRQAA